MTWCLKLISGVAERYCYTRSSSAARVNRLQIATATAWRKGWDSNPRSRCNGTLDFESSALNRTQPPFLLTKRKHRTPNFQHPMLNANFISRFGVRCSAFSSAEHTCHWHRHCSKTPKPSSSMIRANCRERFTAADFDFIVRTLARSQTDHVSIVDLLSDGDTRDSILDHPRLVEAILSHPVQLRISSQFYFYVLGRHVLRQATINDRKLCDYVASLLETFSRASQLQRPDNIGEHAHEYICDMLIALQRLSPEQVFLLRAHIG